MITCNDKNPRLQINLWLEEEVYLPIIEVSNRLQVIMITDYDYPTSAKYDTCVRKEAIVPYCVHYKSYNCLSK